MELVISTFGTSLGRDNEGFVITHKDGRQRIPASKVHSIQLSKGAVVSTDAVMLAVENEIDLFFIDKGGSPVARIWSPKYGSVSTIRKGQLAFSTSSEAVSWIKKIITEKIDNQQAVLLMFDDGSDPHVTQTVNKSVTRLEGYRNKVQSIDAICVSDVASTLRGWEGVASKIYFDSLNLFLPEHLIVDITHSFRSLPMIILNLLLYIKKVSDKKIVIEKVLYGMLEARSETGGYAQIVDLSYMMTISDWIVGAYAFRESGSG